MEGAAAIVPPPSQAHEGRKARNDGLLLCIMPSGLLLPLLAVIVIVLAWKVWRHNRVTGLIQRRSGMFSPPATQMPRSFCIPSPDALGRDFLSISAYCGAIFSICDIRLTLPSLEGAQLSD